MPIERTWSSSAAVGRSVSAWTPARAGKHAPPRVARPRAGVGPAARRRTPRRADRGAARAQAARASFSSRASISLAAISRRSTRRIACPWCGSPTARSTRGRRARPGAGAPRAPRGPVMRARSASPWWVTFTRSVSANEPFRCWWESPARLAAPWRGWSTRAPYVPIGALDRPSGESTDRFAADVAGCAAREQADGRGERALPLYRSTALPLGRRGEGGRFQRRAVRPTTASRSGHGSRPLGRKPRAGWREGIGSKVWRGAARSCCGRFAVPRAGVSRYGRTGAGCAFGRAGEFAPGRS